jgi:hypothetical protein
MSNRLRILTLSGLAILLSISSCKRPEQESAPIKPGDKYQLVDPFNDLIACLDGVHSTLYVLPEERANVLKLLHASGSGDRYMLEAASNIHHKTVPIGFVVKEASLNQLINVGAYFDIARWRIPGQNEAAGRDTVRGELIDTMTSRGIFYRVYRNAQCSKISDGRYTDCEVQITWDFDVGIDLDSTKPYVPKPPKKQRPPVYVKERFYPISHCIKGTSTCVEALGVSSITEFYDNNTCSGAPIRIEESAYDFSCP